METINIINNRDRSRFELTIDGKMAILDYKFYKNNVALMHTAVPEGLKGNGIGSRLVEAAIDFAIEQHKKIMLYCSFAAGYVKERKSLHRFVDTDFHPSLKSSE